MKHGLALILGKAAKGGTDAEDDDDIDIDEDTLEAAQAVRAAKSDEDYAKALKAFVKLCGDY